jgi:T5SS/PEP-CTERM-associated repeat protein/autotransporter-associated beta strand protein
VKVSAGATVSVFALFVGTYGSGNSLEVSDGGQLVTGGDYDGSCTIGFATGSSNNSVLVTGSGSSWNNNSTMNMGYYGSGAVTLANGGSMTAGYLSISGYGGSGALNIGRLGSNDTAGTFSAWSLALRTGGVINFNQSDSTTFSTVISGNGSVNQLGSGTTILTGNNNAYNGTTTVSAGTLLANSSNALGTSLVTVTNSGSLGGNGTIGGATTIASGGNLTPGSDGVGSLSFTNALTLAAESTTSFQIHSSNDFTSINLTGGSVTYGGALVFNLINYVPVAGNEFTVFNMSGGAGESGNFASIEVGGSYLTQDSGSYGIWSGSNAGVTYQFSDSTGKLTVQAVPEPSTWALLGLGALALIMAYRRRNGCVATAGSVKVV